MASSKDNRSAGSLSIGDDISHNLLHRDDSSFPHTPPPLSTDLSQENRSSSKMRTTHHSRESEDFSSLPPAIYKWKVKHFLDVDHTRSSSFKLNGEPFTLGFWPKGGMVKNTNNEMSSNSSKNPKSSDNDITKKHASLSLRYEGNKEVIKCKVTLRMVCLRNPKYSQVGNIDNYTYLGCNNIQEMTNEISSSNINHIRGSIQTEQPFDINVLKSVGFERFIKTKELLPENNLDSKTALVDPHQGILLIEVELNDFHIMTLDSLKLEIKKQELSPEKRAQLILLRQSGNTNSSDNALFYDDDDDNDDMTSIIKIPKLIDEEMLGARIPSLPHRTTKTLINESLNNIKNMKINHNKQHLKVSLKPTQIRPVSSLISNFHPITQKPPRLKISEECLNSSYLNTNTLRRKLTSAPSGLTSSTRLLQTQPNGRTSQTDRPMTGFPDNHHPPSSSNYRLKGDRCLTSDPNASWIPPKGALMGPGNALELPLLPDKYHGSDSSGNPHRNFRFRHHGKELSDEELLHIYQLQHDRYQRKQLEKLLLNDCQFSNNKFIPRSWLNPTREKEKQRLQNTTKGGDSMHVTSNIGYYNNNSYQGYQGQPIYEQGQSFAAQPYQHHPPTFGSQVQNETHTYPYHYAPNIQDISRPTTPILGKMTVTLRPKSAENNHQKQHAKINVSYESKPNTPRKNEDNEEGGNSCWKSDEDVKLDLNISANEACRKILLHMNQHRSGEGESKKFEEVKFIIRDARTGLEFDVDKKSGDQFFQF